MSAVGIAYSVELEFKHAVENRKKFVRFAMKFGRLSLEDAEDTVQDAFLKAFRRLSGFRREAQMDTWITTIVVREILMLHRQSGSLSRSCTTLSVDDPIYFAVRDRLTSDAFSPERTAIGKEALEQVLEAVLS
jgi:RNA polymerase sigma factor (sigma-70 family)